MDLSYSTLSPERKEIQQTWEGIMRPPHLGGCFPKVFAFSIEIVPMLGQDLPHSLQHLSAEAPRSSNLWRSLSCIIGLHESGRDLPH